MSALSSQSSLACSTRVNWESGHPSQACTGQLLPSDCTRQAISPAWKNTSSEREKLPQSGLHSGLWALGPRAVQSSVSQLLFSFQNCFDFFLTIYYVPCSNSQSLNASFEKHSRMCRRLNWFIVALISRLVCDLIGFQKLSFYFYKARSETRLPEFQMTQRGAL